MDVLLLNFALGGISDEPWLCSAHGKDCCLGWIHNSTELLDAEHSQIRDGKCTTRVILGPQFSILGLKHKVLMPVRMVGGGSAVGFL